MVWWFSRESTCQRRSLILDQGRSHMAQQLSPCATIEPVLQSPDLQLLSPHAIATEASVPYSLRSATQKPQRLYACITTERRARSPQPEECPHSNEDPAQPKRKKEIQL